MKQRRATAASSTRSWPKRAALERSLGAHDRARMSDYMDNVREIERRIQKAEEHSSADIELPEQPIGVPATFAEHAT